MTAWSRRTSRMFVVWLPWAVGLWWGLVLSAGSPAFGEPVPRVTMEHPTSLDGKWLFRTGDDPAWAAPDTTSTGWTPIEITRPWGKQGYRGYAGVAWYRQTVQLPPEAGASRAGLGLALELTGRVMRSMPTGIWWGALGHGLDKARLPFHIRSFSSYRPRPFCLAGRSSLPYASGRFRPACSGHPREVVSTAACFSSEMPSRCSRRFSWPSWNASSHK